MSALARFTGFACLAAAVAATIALHASMARGDDTAASEYVRQALAHEAYGKHEVSRHLLESALLQSPDYAPAHWHLGHVQVDGQWVPAADAQSAAAQCDILSTYRKLRAEALDDPRREMSLARWCRRQGWTDHEKLHYSRVALNANADERLRADAVRELHLVQVDGQLLSEDEVAFLQEQAERVEAAMKKWRGPLEEWALAIVGEDAAKAAAAAEALANVDDPNVVPVVESFLLQSGPVFGKHIVRLLGRFPQPRSTQGLARFAVLSPWQDVRRASIDELKPRSLHDFVPMLMDALVAPVQSQFLLTFSPQGTIQYQHVLLRRNSNENRLQVREHVVRPLLIREDLPPGVVGIPRRIEATAEYLTKAKTNMFRASMQASIVEHEVARHNLPVLTYNEPILVALRETTNEPIGRDPADWQSWWGQYNETATEVPIYYEYVPTQSYIVQSMPPVGSCFSAGVPVWTESGLVPIELVQVGDRVLSQDLDTGELTYKLVLRTTALPPTTETVRVLLDGESVDMTKAHVVWVQGEGWRMAKEVEPGVRLHGLSGSLEVRGKEDFPPELEVYNLVVADFNTFFVGESGMLVHDITYMTRRRPTTAVVPGFTPGERAQPTDVLSLPPRSLVRQVRDGFRQ